jgi:hypothetical protein
MHACMHAVQTCQMHKHLGLSNEVSPEKKRCSPHLGLSNDDVSPEKKDVHHILGLAKSMFRAKKNDVHHIRGLAKSMFSAWGISKGW